MQKQKGISTLVGIIIIIAVAVVSFGGVFAYEKFSVLKKENIVPPANYYNEYGIHTEKFDTAGIYINNIKKYQINYIEGTTISEGSAGDPKACVSLTYNKGYIIIKSPNYKDICGNTSSPAGIKYINQYIAINGKRYQANGFIADDTTDEDFYLALPDGTVIDFGIYNDEIKMADSEYANTKNAINQMLSTFKFTE